MAAPNYIPCRTDPRTIHTQTVYVFVAATVWESRCSHGEIYTGMSGRLKRVNRLQRLKAKMNFLLLLFAADRHRQHTVVTQMQNFGCLFRRPAGIIYLQLELCESKTKLYQTTMTTTREQKGALVIGT
jgi:hypothetical protein